MSKARTEAFSDGVIAVAITLLALDLKVPDPHGAGSLAHRLAQQWPNYAAYVVSFITIGIIWINHHAMFRRIAAVDHSILMLNLVLLLTICVLPGSTALMAQYLTAEHGQQLAAAVWGGSFLLMSLAFFTMQRHVLQARSHLLHEHMTPELRRSVLRRNATGLLPYAIATAGAVLTPYITLGMCALVAAFYALPGTTSDVQAEPINPPGTDSTHA
jgi:TMEM175 potassium channel family protein